MLLAVGVIVLVEACFSVPLVILANLDGEFTIFIDTVTIPKLNVSF